MLVLANKADLKDEIVIDEKGLKLFCEEWHCPYLLTSAKTGENVEKAFQDMADMVLQSLPVHQH